MATLLTLGCDGDDPCDIGEGSGVNRLSGRIPGLGNATGRIALESIWMADAASADPDVADFVTRANDWYGTWLAELQATGDDMWERGCGW